MKLLKDKHAVITGANRGIGEAILKTFAENGADIWACARRESEAFENMCRMLSEEFEVKISPIYFDLAEKDEIKSAAGLIRSEKKNIDILVNNAGAVAQSRLFAMLSMDELERIFQVNFFGSMQFTQAIIKTMIRQKSGSIINMSSASAFDGMPAQLEYVSSKAAMVGATRKLALELGVYGIRVNAVAPGSTKTDMIADMDQKLLDELTERTALKRIGDPKEIANAVMFLASDLSGYITGQTIRVDGGLA